MRSPVHVAWIFDDAASVEATVALTSVAAHANPDRSYVLHLLVVDVSPARLEALTSLSARNFAVRVQRLSLSASAYPELPRAKQVVMERIALGRHLPDIDRVLYLDTDLVALRDVGALFDTELDGCPIGAAVDLNVQRRRIRGRPMAGEPTVERHLEKVLSISGQLQERYFNSGVLLLDLDAMRKRGFEDQARTMVSEHPDIISMADQDVLNRMLVRETMLLDGRWNVFPPPTRWYFVSGTEADRERNRHLADPFILHFAGGKPWRHRTRPKAAYWWGYALASPLRGEVLSAFCQSGGKSAFASVRSKMVAPFQMLLAIRRTREARRAIASREAPHTG